MLFSITLGEESLYKHVPTALLPPACLPAAAPTGAVSILITGKPEDLVCAAIRNKTFLTVQHLKELLSVYKVPKPKGTGKRGAIRKIDMAKALVQALFPDETAEAAATLVSGIMNQKVEDLSESPELLLKLTATVGEREAQHFRSVREEALHELEVRTEKTRRETQRKERAREPSVMVAATGDAPPGPSAGVARAAAVPAPSTPVARPRAPQEFVSLLPNVAGLYLKWQPQHRRTSVEFTRTLIHLK